MRSKISLYGHSFCPQVHTVRAILDHVGLGYDYIDIRMDDDGRAFVRDINAGFESVPTLVFPDGTTLTEPSEDSLYAHLLASGYRLDQPTPVERILIYLGNPIIAAFGVGVLIGGGLFGASTVIVVGVLLILLPVIIRVILKLSARISG